MIQCDATFFVQDFAYYVQLYFSWHLGWMTRGRMRTGWSVAARAANKTQPRDIFFYTNIFSDFSCGSGSDCSNMFGMHLRHERGYERVGVELHGRQITQCDAIVTMEVSDLHIGEGVFQIYLVWAIRGRVRTGWGAAARAASNTVRRDRTQTARARHAPANPK